MSTDVHILIFPFLLLLFQPCHTLSDRNLDNREDNFTQKEDTQTNPVVPDALDNTEVLNNLTNFSETDNYPDTKNKRDNLFIYSKVFKYNETIGVQQTFQILDKAILHTNKLIQSTFSGLRDSNSSRLKQTYIKNLHRNQLAELLGMKTRLTSLGFRQDRQINKRSINFPTLINMGFFSHIIGLPNLEDIKKVQTYIDTKIEDLNKGSDRRLNAINEELHILDRLFNLQDNENRHTNIHIFQAIKIIIISSRLQERIDVITDIAMSWKLADTRYNFIFFPDKILERARQEVELQTSTLITDDFHIIRHLNKGIINHINEFEITQTINIPDIEETCLLKTPDKFSLAKCTDTWISLNLNSCDYIEKNYFCQIRPCHFTNLDNICYTINDNLFFLKDQPCVASNGTRIEFIREREDKSRVPTKPDGNSTTASTPPSSIFPSKSTRRTTDESRQGEGSNSEEEEGPVHNTQT